VGVLLSAYRQTDKFLSHNDHSSLLVKKPNRYHCLVTFCIRVIVLEIFYAESTENLFSSAMFIASHCGHIITGQLYQSAAQPIAMCSRKCGRGLRTRLRIDGMTVELIFAAGFCRHCGRHRDDHNFSSLFYRYAQQILHNKAEHDAVLYY